MPHSTLPSTSIPSTSSGSVKRREVNGSVAREAGSASTRTDGVSTPTISASWSRHVVSGEIRREEGVDAPAGGARVERRERREDLDIVRAEPDLLLSLAQGGGEEVCVAGLRLAAGQPELPAVQPAVVRAHDDRDPQLPVRVAEDRDEDCGVPQRRVGHASRSKQVVDRLASAHEPRLTAANENGCGTADPVVVRGHREGVGAGRGHGEQVTPPRRRQRDVVDQHVARLAVHAGNADDLVDRLVRACGRERRVARAVQLRARVVGHAAVHCNPRTTGQPLYAPDAVQRHARPPDEATAGLEPDLRLRQAGLDEGEPRGRCRALGKLGRLRHVVGRVVTDPEPAAEVGDLRRPAELVAAARDERCEPHDRLGLRVEVLELRADVDMHAEHVEPAVERVGDDRPGLVGREPELRAVVAGPDRLVRVGVDPERDADQDVADPGGGRERGLVGRVEHDGRADLGGLCQEHGVFVVPVHDELVTTEACGGCESELSRRGDVRADPFLPQEPQHGDVRQRFRAVEHPAVPDRGPQCPRVRADRLLAQHDERRPVLLRERRRVDARKRQLRAVESRRVGEQR